MPVCGRASKDPRRRARALRARCPPTHTARETARTWRVLHREQSRHGRGSRTCAVYPPGPLAQRAEWALGPPGCSTVHSQLRQPGRKPPKPPAGRHCCELIHRPRLHPRPRAPPRCRETCLVSFRVSPAPCRALQTEAWARAPPGTGCVDSSESANGQNNAAAAAAAAARSRASAACRSSERTALFWNDGTMASVTVAKV